MAQEHAAYIGRQAIFDQTGDVVAYELLYRDSPGARCAIRRGASATAQVLVSACTEFLLDDLVATHAAFVNLSPEFVLGSVPLPVEPSRIGVELTAAVTGEPQYVAGAAALAERGFTIVVDDFRSGRGRDALLPYATYAKVDFLDADDARIEESLAEVRRHPRVQTIACRLHDERAVAAAMRQGFELFQGNALGHPHVLTTPIETPAPAAVQELTDALTDPSVSVARVAALVQADPGLTRYARHAAASNGLLSRNASGRDAATKVGVARMMEWMHLSRLLRDTAPSSVCASAGG